MHNSTPELFRAHLREAVHLVADRPREDRLVFVKSWNEWAEGNYLEPDLRFGHQYLDVIREEVLGRQQAGAASSSSQEVKSREQSWWRAAPASGMANQRTGA